MSNPNPDRRALVVIDVQQGFESEVWGTRNNPECESHVQALVGAFESMGEPIVLVRHDSADPHSPLHPDNPGNALKPVLDGVQPALLVPKQAHSAFHGRIDLHSWLQEQSVGELVICGIQTNRCCETTARVAGDMGYGVKFALDATHTFDQRTVDGRSDLPADLLAQATASNLHGHFGEVVTTAEILRSAKV